MRFALTIITALFLVGCGSPQPVAPTAQITPSSAPSGSGTKRIVQDGVGYILAGRNSGRCRRAGWVPIA